MSDSRLDLTHSLNFQQVFKNSEGRDIAGILFIDGAWKISTEPMFRFSSKAEALHAWETNFDHQSGMPLPCPLAISREIKRNGAG